MKAGGDSVSAWVLVILVYVVAVLNILLMNKIQPDRTKFIGYVVWVVFVCIALTVFVYVYGLMVQGH